MGICLRVKLVLVATSLWTVTGCLAVKPTTSSHGEGQSATNTGGIQSTKTYAGGDPWPFRVVAIGIGSIPVAVLLGWLALRLHNSIPMKGAKRRPAHVPSTDESILELRCGSRSHSSGCLGAGPSGDLAGESSGRQGPPEGTSGGPEKVR